MRRLYDDDIVYLTYDYLKEYIDYDFGYLTVPFECYIISNMKPGDIAEVDYDNYKYTIRLDKLKRILD